jgi:hypothetical protein
MEILVHAFAQVARLADVNDRAEPVLHQVDARFVRQDAQFFADGFSRRHNGISTQSRQGAKRFYGKFHSCASNQIGVISRQIQQRKSMSENQMPPAQTPPPTQPAPTPPGSNESQARMWNMLCHLGGLVPCIPCLCTLLIWQIKKNEFPSVDVHGKMALNFQITMLIVWVAAVIASVVLSFIHLGILMRLLFPLIFLAYLILVIIAGIKANNGEDYKYPFSFQLIK